MTCSPKTFENGLLQVENLTRRCQLQDAELKRSAKQLQEALSIAEEEAAKCKAAKDVIKSLSAQLKGVTERVPGDTYHHNRLAPVTSSLIEAPTTKRTVYGSTVLNGGNRHYASQESSNITSNGGTPFYASDGHGYGRGPTTPASIRTSNDSFDTHYRSDNTTRGSSQPLESDREPGVEWVEQDEAGVYITLVSLPGGGRDLKRVRFSRKRFSEKQAELWWQENKARIHELYHVRVIDKSALGSSIPY
ncbi:hypothetical protein L7F22_062743 [Adiantum nelumboides]|nr:hypothetical protein [Adiantum nelumboides]